eukprot:GHVS01020325.1.p1 GENE.GHVS01020325.1~~GHVS01020325.1.p1  ORF type:complete len:752 (+),score=120.61 GHVS01020325.1:79-2256(+)
MAAKRRRRRVCRLSCGYWLVVAAVFCPTAFILAEEPRPPKLPGYSWENKESKHLVLSMDINALKRQDTRYHSPTKPIGAPPNPKQQEQQTTGSYFNRLTFLVSSIFLPPSSSFSSFLSSFTSLPPPPVPSSPARCQSTAASAVRQLQEIKAVKPLSSFSRLDALGVVLIAFACAVSITVGMGGGGIFVPILILVMGFTAHTATALSQSLMVGGALAALLLNSLSRHPTNWDRPLIDVDKVLLLGPMMTAGALLGVQINKMICVVLIVLLMLAVLSLSTYLTSTSAVIACKDEFHRREVRRERNFTSELCAEADQPAERRSSQSPAVAAATPDIPSVVSLEPAPTRLCLDLFTKSRSLPSHLVGELSLGDLNVNAENPSVGRAAASDVPLRSMEHREEQQKNRRNSSDEDMREYTRRQVYVHCSSLEEAQDEEETMEDIKEPKKEEEGSMSAVVTPPPSAKIGTPEKCVPWRSLSLAEEKSQQTKRVAAWIKKTSLLNPPKRDWKKGSLIFVIWAINICFTVFRGGKNSPIKLIEFCGIGYWFLFAASVLLQMLWSVGFAAYLWKVQSEKQTQKKLVQGDIVYSPGVLFLWCLISVLAGIIAGIVGIGGGMLLGPIMLKTGCLPQVVSAVNATLILVSASSAATAQLAAGAMEVDWALVLASTCFAAALFGKFVLDRIVKRYRLSSLLVVLLLFMILLSAAALLVAAALSIANDPQNAIKFHGPCY